MIRSRRKHLKSFKILGENIRNIRNDKKISQEELAFRISSAKNYIGCIERGEKFPSISIVLDIANALDVQIKDLFENI